MMRATWTLPAPGTASCDRVELGKTLKLPLKCGTVENRHCFQEATQLPLGFSSFPPCIVERRGCWLEVTVNEATGKEDAIPLNNYPPLPR